MKKPLKRIGITLLVLSIFLIITFLLRAPLLREAANLWIVNEPLTNADAILVLGGGLETRPFEAARLFHQGLAPKILVTTPKPSPSEEIGLTTPGAEVVRQILLKKEVPASAIVVIPSTVTSTYEEAIAVRDWARTNGIKRVIIPTEIFPSRRTRWVFRKKLGQAGIRVEVEALAVRAYTEKNWWQHEEGLIAFQNELVKSVYYHIKY